MGWRLYVNRPTWRRHVRHVLGSAARPLFCVCRRKEERERAGEYIINKVDAEVVGRVCGGDRWTCAQQSSLNCGRARARPESPPARRSGAGARAKLRYGGGNEHTRTRTAPHRTVPYRTVPLPRRPTAGAAGYVQRTHARAQGIRPGSVRRCFRYY